MCLPLRKPVWRTLKKLKLNLPYEPAIPLLVICSKDSTSYLTDNGSAMFTDALLTRARTWKQTKCPSIDKWITKMWYTGTIQDTIQV